MVSKNKAILPPAHVQPLAKIVVDRDNYQTCYTTGHDPLYVSISKEAELIEHCDVPWFPSYTLVASSFILQYISHINDLLVC